MTAENTVLLRLEGPLQAWGVTSRFVVRDTADVPTKSGVIGLICAALGLRRGDANGRLKELTGLRMGVRIDRPGELFADFHTAGAGIGMMAAKGEIKFIPGTKVYEPVLMRKEYLADAAFLVALQGDPGTVKAVADALQNPVWPPFLGRKSCPPSAPVFAKPVGTFDDLIAALGSRPWCPRLAGIDVMPHPFRAVVEVRPEGGPIPADARPVQDVPISFTHRVYGTRFVQEVELGGVVPGGAEFTEPPSPDRRPATIWPGWDTRRKDRLDFDHWRCVFCKSHLPQKSQATQVHHVTYERAGAELREDLRSVCRVCHDAMTLLEYAAGMSGERIDPCDLRHRDAVLDQRKNILTHRDRLRRNRALRAEED
jgi:CRISPR system Cascade subunit CasD